MQEHHHKPGGMLLASTAPCSVCLHAQLLLIQDTMYGLSTLHDVHHVYNLIPDMFM